MVVSSIHRSPSASSRHPRTASRKATPKASEGKAPPAEKATRKARDGSPSPAPKAPPPPPQDDALEALCAALLALIVAHQATTQSRGAIVVLDVLQQVLLLARSFSRCGAGVLSLVTGPHMTGLAWHPATSSPPSTPSSSTTRSTPAPALPSFQFRVCGSLANAFDAQAEADQLAAHMAFTSRGVTADRLPLDLSNLDEIAGDLRDALFALAGSLCEASNEATGLPAQSPPMAHALRLREVLDLDDEEGLRNLRRRQVLTDARRAFTRPDD